MRMDSKNWMAQYRAKIDADDAIQTCALCGVVGSKSSLERHHPYRRLHSADGTNNLFRIKYLCRRCHDEVECGMHPELLVRDNSNEQRFHDLREGENLLKIRKDEDV